MSQAAAIASSEVYPQWVANPTEDLSFKTSDVSSSSGSPSEPGSSEQQTAGKQSTNALQTPAERPKSRPQPKKGALLHSRRRSLSILRNEVDYVLRALHVHDPQLDFIRQFLFTTDVEADVTSFSNPIAVSRAVVASKSLCSTPSTKAEDAFRFASKAVFVPTMSASGCDSDGNPYSVSLGVVASAPEYSIALSIVGENVNSIRTSRFLVDNISGARVEISHSTPKGRKRRFSTIYMSFPESTKLVRSISVICDTKAFLRGVEKHDRTMIDASVLLSLTSFYSRSCMVCGCPAPEVEDSSNPMRLPKGKAGANFPQCDCKLSLGKPAHPLDYKHLVPSLLVHCGGGTGPSHAVFSKVTTGLGFDGLRAWWANFTNTTEYDDRELFTAPMRSSVYTSWHVVANDESKKILPSNGLQSILQIINLVTRQMTDSSPLLTTDEEGNEISADERCGSRRQIQTALALTNGPNFTADSSVPPGENSLVTAACTYDDICEDRIRTVHQVLSRPRRKATAPGNDSGSAGEGEENCPDGADATSKGDEILEDPTARKMRQRKLKNREAAARSNAKRKADHDARKQALAQANERKEQLQIRWAQLLAENERLRSELAE